MDQRHAAILHHLVRTYISTGKPVSSKTLARSVPFTISSATIRLCLRDLAEASYIHQPHTSAGRIPTDLGYRFYVDHVRAHTMSAARRQHIQYELKQLLHEYGRLARSASELLSRLSHTIAISSVSQERDVREAGLAELLNQPEAETIVKTREVSHILSQLSQHLPELSSGTEDSSGVYIGAEIPFFPAKHTSLIFRTTLSRSEGKVTLILVGPKRMPYQRNQSLLEAITNIIKEL